MKQSAAARQSKPRIAIIGAGISGLVSAYRLNDAFDVHVFEANSYPGGHSNTVDVTDAGGIHAVDTGFIVYNEHTYPRFTRLLKELGVQTRESEMSFSVSCDATGLEWAGGSLNALFAQRRNIVRPSFHRMVRDILRFNRQGPALIADPATRELTLGTFLERHRYSRAFIDDYLLPMCAAVWSAPPSVMRDFPVQRMLRFLDNHGLLQIRNRPQWRCISGGSRRYVRQITRLLKDRLYLSTPVTGVRRRDGHVELALAPGAGAPLNLQFDHVILACHSDQALAMIEEPTAREQEILRLIPYQENEAVLHSDASLMPSSRRTWAAWNYRKPAESSGQVTVTYNMNILQQLGASETWCVTLNDTARIDPSRIAGTWTYHHPVFGEESARVHERIDEISGRDGIWFCGAYWGYGFHEDGVRSAEQCVSKLKASYETGSHAQLPLPRHARPSAA